MDYTYLYHLLFNAITNALDSMEPDTVAADLLRGAQLCAEDYYIEQGKGA